MLLALLTMTVLAVGCSTSSATEQIADAPSTTTREIEPTTSSSIPAAPEADPSTTTAVTDDGSASEGYNLFAPQQGTVTYLTDLDNNVVWSWASDYRPALSAYLLDDGNLLRPGNVGNETFDEAGAGGIIQVLNPDGSTAWDFTYSGDTYLQHHDVEPLPNGNVLLIAWESKTADEVTAAGRTSSVGDDGLIVDHIVEVEPDGDGGGSIVWEWHAWDHLIQDEDPGLADYGDPSGEPGRIDVNYVGGPPNSSDWTHFNSIAYNEELDQIMVSSRFFSEIWIIDHSTTTAEAATSTGGTSGQGGDLVYRWGNPAAYGQDDATRELFSQHDATWIPEGYPGEGDILVFNNGAGRPDGNYSTVDQITPPLGEDGRYLLDGATYGPTALTWTWQDDDPTSFYADRVSGAQRLADGTTMIINGTEGLFLEVSADAAELWEFDYGSGVFKARRYPTDYLGLPDIDEWDGETTPTTAAGPGGQGPGQGARPSGPGAASPPGN